jgi:hypothetical protein
MMISPSLYSPENVARSKYIHGALIVLAAAICAYLIATTALSSGQIWKAESMLREEKAQAAGLSRDARKLRKQAVHGSVASSPGVASFAADFSRWASARRLRIESFAPEGEPTSSDVAVGQVKLGTWCANRVRVQGRGEFAGLMSLLEEFREPQAPVQLNSIALTSSGSGAGSLVSFNIVLTVYEQSGGPS